MSENQNATPPDNLKPQAASAQAQGEGLVYFHSQEDQEAEGKPQSHEREFVDYYKEIRSSSLGMGARDPDALVAKVCSYDSSADPAVIMRAYEFSKEMHEGQLRKSGEPYIVHPLAVASVLADMRLDYKSVMTGLLHDTIEDTPATDAQVRDLFGNEVALLVDGVTKLSKYYHSKATEGDIQARAAENFRKFVLASARDIRVLLVKLADRLDNMRTLSHLREEKQKRIAAETLEIYAPIADRLGLKMIKDELEELAFSTLFPDVHRSLIDQMQSIWRDRERNVGVIIKQIQADLQDRIQITPQITGRVKSPYSIWKKMRNKQVELGLLSDIMAFRVVVDDVSQCYAALGVLHNIYSVVPHRFKDYISTPKPNGYQSIHTGLQGPNRSRIEVQIRTHEMHAIAERGVAAHWAYKQGDNADAHKNERTSQWLDTLVEIIEDSSGPEELAENSKLDLYSDEVFAFTPKGRLIVLPQGSCIIDFAYAVHTDVGNTCSGGRINGLMRPLDTRLKTGDEVEVLTAKGNKPRAQWKDFVVTATARSQIRKFIRMTMREKYEGEGRDKVKRAFHKAELSYTENDIAIASRKMGYIQVGDLYAAVGNGTLLERTLIEQIYPGIIKEQLQQTKKAGSEQTPIKTGIKSKSGLPEDSNVSIKGIKGIDPNMARQIARCCHPIPGDKIVGIVTSGKGVTIHTRGCENLSNFIDQTERFIEVSWNVGDQNERFTGRVKLVVPNNKEVMPKITAVIAKRDGNITNIKYTRREYEFFELLMDIDVADVENLRIIIAALTSLDCVISAERSFS